MDPNDWRNKEDYNLWQRRQFLMSCFIRTKTTLNPDVYDFIDLLISQGYQTTEDLSAVDRYVIGEYKKYTVSRLYIRDYDDDGYPD